MATTGYQAAPETNDVLASYALEATWATLPAVAFQALRMTGETLAGKKTRQRPAELRTDGQVASAVTTEESAGGNLNFAFSYGVYDDLVAALIGSTWSPDLAIVGIAGDISAVASGNKFTSTLATKFEDVEVGQWIKTSGFTTPGNNGYSKVTAKTDDDEITVVGLTLTNETPAGTAANINGSMIRNGTVFQTLYIQKMLEATKFMRYPGSFLSAGTITAQQGKFAEGNFSFIPKEEVKNTADASTGAVLAAPANTVFDNVEGFKLLTVNNAVVPAVCKGIDITMTRQGAAGEYGVGSAAAQGIIKGLLEVTGKASFYFKDFDLYDMYKAETRVPVSHLKLDAEGNAYMFTVLYAALMNPSITASAPNQAVMADFDLEGNPHPTFGATIQIDRFPV
jgi:hypothetical protein